MGRSSGIGFLTALGLLFIGLKLVGTIDWSWVWVLAPFWVSPVMIFLAIILYAVLNNGRLKRG